MDSSQLYEPLAGKAGRVFAAEGKAERSRWWVLFLYMLLAITQGATWNVFAPISDALETAYGSTWNGSFIALLLNVSSGTFFIWLQPTSVAIDRYGVRAVTIFSSTVLAASCLMRCAPLEGAGLRNAMMLSFILNGFSGCWLNFGGPVISEVWFPQKERTLATSLGATSTYIGSSAGFLAGPLIVGSPDTEGAARHYILLLHMLWAGVSTVTCLCCWCYYPDCPTSPPSEAAAKKKREAAEALPPGPTTWRDLLVGSTDRLFCASSEIERGQRKRFWLITICLAVPLGVYQGWLATFHLSCPELSSNQAGWLGCTMTLSGCVGSVAVGALLDRFNGRLKSTICVLLFLAAASFGVFAAAATGIESTVFLFVFGILGGMMYNTTTPLYFELAMETIYGWASENAASMVLILVNTIFQIAYVALPQKMGGTVQWPGFLAVATLVGSFVLLSAIPVRYFRLEEDLSATRFEAGSGKPVGSPFDRRGCIEVGVVR